MEACSVRVCKKPRRHQCAYLCQDHEDERNNHPVLSHYYVNVFQQWKNQNLKIPFLLPDRKFIEPDKEPQGD